MLTLLVMQHTTTGAGWLPVGLVILVISYLLSLSLLDEPAADWPGAAFSAAAALERLERLAGDELPHPLGSAENARIRDELVSQFSELGYEVEVQAELGCRVQWASCALVENVIARLPGTAGVPSVLLSAHYDSVGAGPGVADDLAGVAALLEVARLERDADRLNPLLFVISDGEELGLLGAEAFTRHEAFADVAAVVNVEARGTSGPSLLFETNTDNAWIIEAFAAEASRPLTSSLFYELYRLLPNDTDFSVYRDAGLQGLNFAAIGDSRYYHTPLDNLANLSVGTLQHHGDNLLAAARALRAADLSGERSGDALFHPLLPGQLFVLPVGWAFYLSLAGLVLWFVAAARLIGSGSVSSSGLLFGVLFPLAALLLAASAGQLVSAGLPQLSGQPAPWWSDSQPAFLALLLLALFAALLSGVVSAGRSGFWGLALGVWFWFALTGFLLLEYLPGASVVFLLPATAFAVVYGLLALSPGRSNPLLTGLAALAGLFVTAVIWLQLCVLLADVLGLEAGLAISLAAALALLGLLPLLAVPRGARLLPLGLSVLALAAGLVAGFRATTVETFTVASPQLIDVLHFELASEGISEEALWLLDAVPAQPVPFALLEELTLSGWPEPVLPWTDWAFHVAPADPAPLEFPSVRQLPAQAGGLRLALESARGADQLHLFVPADSGLQQIVVAGSEYVIDYRGSASGLQQFSCYSPACDGLELELLFSGGRKGPVPLLVVDQAPGVPAAGERLLALRDAAPAVPWQDGDVTLRANRVVIKPD